MEIISKHNGIYDNDAPLLDLARFVFISWKMILSFKPVSFM